jgi:hypothetical protein
MKTLSWELNLMFLLQARTEVTFKKRDGSVQEFFRSNGDDADHLPPSWVDAWRLNSPFIVVA